MMPLRTLRPPSLNQNEIQFEIITRQVIRRGTFSSVHVLNKDPRLYRLVERERQTLHLDRDCRPGEILVRVCVVQTN